MPLSTFFSVLIFAIIAAVVIAIFRSIRIVPAKTVMIVERLGKYNRTLHAGLKLLTPVIDKVRYKHSLKEQALDVPTQPCFTQDNVKVDVDGVLYFRVMDPYKASYGITNYHKAAVQLAQTTMRSVIGQLELDKTFEEREAINAAIVKGIQESTEPWGVQITRYEIQNIRVPKTILSAMEVQMRAEREKRAEIAKSEGEMESRINYSQGIMEESINKSEGERQKRINEAEGKASEILAIAKATATGILKVSKALENKGGDEAMALQIADGYIQQLKNLKKENTKIILPMDLSDISSVVDKIKKLSAPNI